MRKTLAFLFVGMALNFAMQAQLSLPQASQKAVLTQTIGITDITVTYHRPKVKDREVWGKLVPHYENATLTGNQKPWRAGANQNTTISFTHDVKVEGKDLAAGTYGLHMIPSEKEWVVIFSENTSSWGSFFYKENEDALRVKVMPISTSHHELLTYDVIDHTPNSATIALSWEKKQIPVKVEVDVHEIVLASMRDELRSTPGFTWQGWNTAANYCLNNNINHEEAITFADNAIQRGGGFPALATKSGLLIQLDRGDEAEKLMANAMNQATNQQLNTYGYTLLNQGKMDKAIEVFKLNTEKNPNDPNVFDSLGEGYTRRGADGDKKLAIKAFEKSLSMNPPANVRANSLTLLKKLGVDTEKYESATARKN